MPKKTGERQARFETRYVTFMPETKEPGILYVSDRFRLAIHLCACGCGVDTVMPYDKPGGWTLTRDGDVLTFSPSILNQGCNAHYFIERNEVRWA